MKQNLYIDFDGVIMDTITPSYKKLDELNIDDTDTPEVDKFYQKLDWANLLSISEEIDDSFNKIQKILDSEIYNVFILTHVNSLQEIIAKVEFLRKKLKTVTIIAVPIDIQKTKIVNPVGAILIDDYTPNVVEWIAKGGIGVKFCKEKKNRKYLQITNLLEILETNLINL